MEIMIVWTNQPRIESIMKEYFEVIRYYRNTWYLKFLRIVSHIYTDYVISQGSNCVKEFGIMFV